MISGHRVLSQMAVLSVLVGCTADRRKQTEDPHAYQPDLSLKFRCAELARHQSEWDQSHADRTSIVEAVRFGYTAELKTCIYEGHTYANGTSSGYIADMLTGEVLASYMQGVLNPAPQKAAKERFDAIEGCSVHPRQTVSLRKRNEVEGRDG
jgi:hypothetical protein